jgi:hypothetical protein
VLGAAVHDAMADGDQFIGAETILDEFQQGGEHRPEVPGLVRRPAPFHQTGGLVACNHLWG